MKSQEHTNGRYINMTYNYEEKMLMFPLMPYCASAFRWLGCRAMAESHVQHVHNCLIGIWTVKLRITSTRHCPIEPLANIKCSLIHMVKMSIDKHTKSRKLQPNEFWFIKWIKGFLKSKFLKNLWNSGEIKHLLSRTLPEEIITWQSSLWSKNG